MREASDGGLVTPEYKQIIGELVKEGRVYVREGREAVGVRSGLRGVDIEELRRNQRWRWRWWIT